ncbi:hypothetical protein H5410_014505 [Solanum commersonii]|uniref:Uncharacterized protein n=1 Tax=Solanum commersonii TaxID=4109 RepID=A0A9J5ZR44_SOLCO|nr:hypothetical protein H5410_014505 [Solanum commersonii]
MKSSQSVSFVGFFLHMIRRIFSNIKIKLQKICDINQEHEKDKVEHLPNSFQAAVASAISFSLGIIVPIFKAAFIPNYKDGYGHYLLPKKQVSLADWALHCHRKNTTKELMDAYIKREIIKECLKQFINTAVSCLSDHRTDHPSMVSVLWNLEHCL